ncbi:MAG: molybdopterin molybdenumtransferase MoeA, partial [Campylobacteraceae bacterium]|nr:molybdopterin molybdenumtransferase MoeA [Campylobacteraceae bacterium]
LAELGVVNVEIVCPPRVGVIAAGSEIVDVGEELENDSQIRSSNNVLLASLAKHWGAEPILFPVIKDDKKLIRDTIKEALIHCDIVVTTGGVSVGDFDYVRDIINEYGTEPIINGAAIKPGRHVRILKFGEKYLCSFPGFPYSAAVTFRLYAVPIILYFLGLDTAVKNSYAYLQQDYVRKTKFSEFASCFCYEEKGKILLDFNGKRVGSSAILNNLLDNSPLLIISESVQNYKKGDLVPIIKMVP